MMTYTWHKPRSDERAVERLAELIALKLMPGDIVALSGDLGAGKTTFARALIRSHVGDAGLEVPSPTFGLLQSYDCGRFPLAHLDLYRITSPDEVAELGLEEQLKFGALVIEWPERMSEMPGDNCLVIALQDEAGAADKRQIVVTASGTWCARLQRVDAIAEFLDTVPQWQQARLNYLQGDASPRAYARFSSGLVAALLMDAPAKPDGTRVKGGRAYSSVAHLAESVRPFLAVAEALRSAGLSAPRIYDADINRGLLIVEDFGDRVFTTALNAGMDQQTLWSAACDVLIHLRNKPAPETLPVTDGTHVALAPFDSRIMHSESGLLLEWYWPFVHGGPAPEAVHRDFAALCAPLFETANRTTSHWLLRDFHSPNLIWLPERDGLQRVGVIDFQDALRGPAEYDLVSLLQDARVDVPEALELHLLERYCDKVGIQAETAGTSFDRDASVLRYRILGVQRNLKILGIFARLARRDGKLHYLDHLPRIWGYLARNLEHPEIKTLKSWIDGHFSEDVRITKAVS